MSELSSNLRFFQVFNAMIAEGMIADIGVYSFAVYTAIKSHINYTTGDAFPSIELIAKLTGMTDRQAIKSLAVLEQKGLVTKERHGRKNHYKLNELFNIQKGDDVIGSATVEYKPNTIQETIQELKTALAEGNLFNTQNITFNITLIQNSDNATVNNTNTTNFNNGYSDFKQALEKIKK